MATLKEIRELRALSNADLSTCNKYLELTNNNIKAAYAKMKHDKIIKERALNNA